MQDCPAVTRLAVRRWRTGLGVGAAAIGLAILVSTYLPGAPLVPAGVTIPLGLVLAIVFFGWAVIEAAGRRSAARRTAAGDPSATPTSWNQGRAFLAIAQRRPVVVAIIIPVLIALWFIMIVSIGSLGGQPTQVDNSYYLTDHGSRTQVSRATYEDSLAEAERLFAAGSTLFLLFSVGLTMTSVNEDARRPERQPGPSQPPPRPIDPASPM